MKDKSSERAAAVQKVLSAVASGAGLPGACAEAGVSRAWFDRWNARFREAGIDGLSDLPRTGRPRNVDPTEEDGKALRRNYLQSNLNAKAGSMTLAARYAAKTGQLSEALAKEILKPRASKHLLPVAVKRLCRACAADVARYRNPKAGQNDGLYTPGWLRMASDGSRRLCPNERWVGDDASVNVGVCVPWTRGGDRCSEAFGVRVARFQLLAMIDCATDLCVGYSYVMRLNDAYTAADVVSMIWRSATLRGGMPAEMVMEGGSWQARRTVDFLNACGTRLVSAKGRPNQKLIEGWFNRLWSVMSLTLPPGGQVGRFRGEMGAEKELWMRCRKGVENPKLHFPMLPAFLKSLDGAIDYCNTEVVGPTREYGTWIPAEAYAAASGMFPAAALRPLPAGIRRFALPVREGRVLRRGGMLFVRAACPFGWPHEYAFAVRDGAMFDGAPVTVSFDPMEPGAGAYVELSANWHDLRAGRMLDEAAACVSPAPELVRAQGGVWGVNVLDPRNSAAEIKRSGRALVATRVAAFDARGKVATRAEDLDGAGRMAERFGFGEREAEPAAKDGGYDNDVDFAALERAAGIA
ncbi:MAG TPA: helix-turn-helix domain-containing protein [Kiritimatiellia bacterium]|nr:helix-turn-helix domain-containing protein [Kiritimatiellia bacterium]